MTRKQANLKILKELRAYVTHNPDQRFGQILRNIGIIVDFQAEPKEPGGWEPVQWGNHFNEEPEHMLKRMIETANKKV